MDVNNKNSRIVYLLVKMVCIFCLKETNDGISIFGESTAAENTRAIIVKYFWFNVSLLKLTKFNNITPENTILLQANDINSAESYACSECWSKVEAFHEFYHLVEAVHKQDANENDDKISLNSPHTFGYELGEDAESVGKIESDTSDSFPKHEPDDIRSDLDPDSDMKLDKSAKAIDFEVEKRHTPINTSSAAIEEIESFDPSNERKIDEIFDIQRTSSKVQVPKNPTKTRRSIRTIDEIV